ncbi:YT521-B-like domain-containing protein [Lasiosphaeria miniovina]|uniref:YT521-B-like domain-containing protein n=1 Tax=Lasiosphaeria miniovina TaxID=1954250 RepID=A0AA40EDE8_9PEZI|nr:YT521-B-like domain-containing protein [Lasiosphaeria miniovina]KAK0733341.1 YT521-B-like domain-containing protein [Lasiosphaeria miniovina]
MGDTPAQPGAPPEFPRQDAAASSFQASSLALHQHQHQHSSPQHQHAFASQLDMTQPHGPSRLGAVGPFDLSAMSSALPQPTYRPGPPYGQAQQRYNLVGAANPGIPSQAPLTVPQYGTHNVLGSAPNPQYFMPQHTHMPQFYATPLPPQAAQPNMALRPELGYYPNAVVVGQQQSHPVAHYYYSPASHFAGQAPQVQTQLMLGQHTALNPYPAESAQQSSRLRVSSTPPVDQGHISSDTYPNAVRGPPRKPRQSGHAIWIGNLPPQTDLMSLVHHVCSETGGLESLFLISKSNCAFANFKGDQACVTAQRKLHDSKFLTVRLVSRLRKSTVEGPAGVTAPTGPAATSTPQSGASQESSEAGISEASENNAGRASPTPAAEESELASPPADATSLQQQKDRFFILKSLTVEDLELSVKTSIWATQSHNETTLNSAFQEADNVYLVFSANKSGEYFGYARMASPINDDPAEAIEFAPKAQPSDDVELPKAIPTEATGRVPKGRIIDDSARGTIFWEAESDEAAPEGQDDDGSGGGSVGGDTGSVRSGHEGGGGGGSKAWGKPFRLEWLSTARLPFYRTRGLRNPWNSNREVKIARDGTELEPSVGRRLVGLFNRAQSPNLGLSPSVVVPGGAFVGGFHSSVPTGFSPLRPV